MKLGNTGNYCILPYIGNLNDHTIMGNEICCQYFCPIPRDKANENFKWKHWCPNKTIASTHLSDTCAWKRLDLTRCNSLTFRKGLSKNNERTIFPGNGYKLL